MICGLDSDKPSWWDSADFAKFIIGLQRHMSPSHLLSAENKTPIEYFKRDKPIMTTET